MNERQTSPQIKEDLKRNEDTANFIKENFDIQTINEGDKQIIKFQNGLASDALIVLVEILRNLPVKIKKPSSIFKKTKTVSLYEAVIEDFFEKENGKFKLKEGETFDVINLVNFIIQQELCAEKRIFKKKTEIINISKFDLIDLMKICQIKCDDSKDFINKLRGNIDFETIKFQIKNISDFQLKTKDLSNERVQEIYITEELVIKTQDEQEIIITFPNNIGFYRALLTDDEKEANRQKNIQEHNNDIALYNLLFLKGIKIKIAGEDYSRFGPLLKLEFINGIFEFIKTININAHNLSTVKLNNIGKIDDALTDNLKKCQEIFNKVQYQLKEQEGIKKIELGTRINNIKNKVSFHRKRNLTDKELKEERKKDFIAFVRHEIEEIDFIIDYLKEDTYGFLYIAEKIKKLKELDEEVVKFNSLFCDVINKKKKNKYLREIYIMLHLMKKILILIK